MKNKLIINILKKVYAIKKRGKINQKKKIIIMKKTIQEILNINYKIK